MSQTVKLTVAMTDKEAIRRACVRLDLPAPIHGRVKLYRDQVEGTLVQLPGWRYQVAILADGSVKFDNYNNHWGDMSELDRLAQYYVIEGARIQAENTGGVVTEEVLENQDVKLVVEYA